MKAYVRNAERKKPNASSFKQRRFESVRDKRGQIADANQAEPGIVNPSVQFRVVGPLEININETHTHAGHSQQEQPWNAAKKQKE